MNATSHSLKGQIALVTGAASGIGAAITVELRAPAAASASITTPIARAPRETAAVIREAAGDVVLLEADVCSEAAVEAMFAEAKRAFGTPTILVNSAGIDALGKPIAEMSLAEWEAALRTNLTEPFLCARAFVRGLAQANAAGGKIVNIGSVHEEIPKINSD